MGSARSEITNQTMINGLSQEQFDFFEKISKIKSDAKIVLEDVSSQKVAHTIK